MTYSEYLMTLVIIIIGSTCSVESVTHPCQGEVFYPEHGNQLEISCNFSSNSFLAVFWYRENTGTDPFLRIDGNIKTTPEGFDITDEGAMVIKKPGFEHDNLYINQLIENDGGSQERSITINVKYVLATNPRIEECGSSDHDLCNNIESNKRDNTLLCIAGGARPPVTLIWVESEHLSLAANTTMNTSTNLYTSTSLLEYKPNDFVLEYFTCNVTGEAVLEPRPVGMFVRGSKEVKADTQAIKYVKSGSGLNLECPELSNNQLGEWELVYPNDTSHLLWRKYPNYESPCDYTDGCKVQSDGTISLNKVTHSNEGTYVCSFSNDKSDGIREIPVEVHVSPEPMKTVITGCEDSMADQCELNVANVGSLECSIFGSRPSMKPVLIVSDTVNNIDVFLHNYVYTAVDGGQPGTHDNMLSVEFDIPECSDVVKVECLPGDNNHEDKIAKSTVKLVTATSGCGEESSGRPGLAVFLVLFFIILIVGAIVFVVKRDYILKKFSGKETPTDHEAGMSLPKQDNTEEESTLSQNKYETVAIVEVKNRDTNEEETNTLQESFNNTFQPIFDRIISKKATQEEFNAMMNSFCKDNKVKIPVPYLSAFLKRKNKSSEVREILQFVLDNFQKQWVSYFLKMLDELLENKKVSATNYISFIGNLLQKRVIELSRYVELTGSLYDNKIVEFDIIMSALKNMIDKRYFSREDFSYTLLRYYLGSYISEETVISEMFSETTSYSFLTPYFLQSTYQEFQQKNESESTKQLCYIFKKVWEKLMGEDIKLPINLDNYPKKDAPAATSDHKDNGKQRTEGERQPQEDLKNAPHQNENDPLMQPSDRSQQRTTEVNVTQEETDPLIEQTTNQGEKQDTNQPIKSMPDKPTINKILQKCLISALLISMDSKMIMTDECVEMIQKLPQKEVEQSVCSYIQNPRSSEDYRMKLLEQTLVKKVISDKIYVTLLWDFVKPKGKITFDNYMGNLKESLREKLISEICFEQKVTECIKDTAEKIDDQKKKKIDDQKKKKTDDKRKKKSKMQKEEEEETDDKRKKKSKMQKEEEEEWDEQRWIQFITELAKEEIIASGLRITLYQCVVTTNKMKQTKVKHIMKKEMNIGNKDSKPFLDNVKFK